MCYVCARVRPLYHINRYTLAASNVVIKVRNFLLPCISVQRLSHINAIYKENQAQLRVMKWQMHCTGDDNIAILLMQVNGKMRSLRV